MPSNSHQVGYAVLLLSGPITGQSLANRVFVDCLREKFDLNVIDLGPGNARTKSNLLRWLLKAGRSLLASLAIAVGARSRTKIVYMGAQANWGLITDWLIAAAARLRGVVPIVHHHTFNYIHTPDVRMKILVALAGSRAIHVMLCPRMSDEFCARYGVNNTIVVHNSLEFDVPPNVEVPERSATFTIGHLSNLSMEKGLVEVIETFEKVAACRLDVELHLAGPLTQAAERALVERTVEKFGGRVKYLGPVYGEAKIEFYKRLHAFLFPTKYKNEASPLVLDEAMLCGVPCITIDRACICHQIKSGGVIVSGPGEYVEIASKTIQEWADSPELHRAAQDAARRQGLALRDDAAIGKLRLIQTVGDLVGAE